MTELAKRARAIEPTLIRQLRDQAGPSSLDLGLGQPDLPVAEPVREALVEALEEGRAPYTHNLGLWETREAIADHYGVDAAQVMVTCGAQEALAVAVLGLVEPGDEVLVPDPGFPAYPNLVRMAEATPVPYALDADDDFRLVPERIESALSERTRMAIFNSPSNPTGAVHDRRDLEEVHALLEERDVLWVADEIYEDYDYEGAFASVLDAGAPLASGAKISGLSKSHHTMGWRLGWLISDEAIVEGLKPLHQHLVTCAPTPVQRATCAALGRHEELFAPTLAVFERRRRRAMQLADRLPEVGYVAPRGAFYLFLDLRAYTETDVDGRGSSALELARSLLQTEDVVVIPGAGFGAGGEGFWRVAYTVEESLLEEAFERMAHFLQSIPESSHKKPS